MVISGAAIAGRYGFSSAQVAAKASRINAQVAALASMLNTNTSAQSAQKVAGMQIESAQEIERMKQSFEEYMKQNYPQNTVGAMSGTYQRFEDMALRWFNRFFGSTRAEKYGNFGK